MRILKYLYFPSIKICLPPILSLTKQDPSVPKWRTLAPKTWIHSLFLITASSSIQSGIHPSSLLWLRFSCSALLNYLYTNFIKLSSELGFIWFLYCRCEIFYTCIQLSLVESRTLDLEWREIYTQLNRKWFCLV